ncbi:MAG: hypothetical protein KatS3mg115_0083 [Candidatus Poribacteria bacterium]|nr:MAG: hypothetical protein KatS3mg115_0083 [Candidatus Poribacteria bacterium]
MGNKTPVLLDTDIGSDIDDAVCLAYLLRQQACELLGVTTVSGDTVQRAALADAVCRAAGKEGVPIYPGSPGPLWHGPGQPHVPQYEAIQNRPHRLEFPSFRAVAFLQEAIRSRPGEVVLLAIGPLTNVALLFLTDPEIPEMLRELVLMNGVFTARGGHGPGAREWNALCDPLATGIVYRAKTPRTVAIGLEVTTRCVLDADTCRRRFREAGGPLSIVAQMAEVWFRGRSQITFHDPLAAATIFRPELCEYQDGEVRVETGPGPLAGLTQFLSHTDQKRHRIAVEVNPEAFFEHYFAVVSGSGRDEGTAS